MFSSLSSTCKSLPLGPWDLTCIIYITHGYKVIAVHSFVNGETHRTAKVGFVLWVQCFLWNLCASPVWAYVSSWFLLFSQRVAIGLKISKTPFLVEIILSKKL
jgi:hypothetical protein